MRILLLLLASIACLAQAPYRSLMSGYGSATLPSTAAFNGLTALRIEFRYTPSGTSGRIVSVDSVLISQGSGVISATSFFGGSDTITINYGSATDIIVRFTQTAEGMWLDAWSADGATYYQGQSQAQALGTIDLRGDAVDVRHTGGGTGGTAGTIAWLRVYSAAIGSMLIRTTTPAPSNAVAASPLLDYEYEGNGTDSSANAASLTMTGGGYGSTTVIPQVNESITVRTSGAATLDCTGTNADSYKWRYIGTAQGIRIASQTSGSTTATGMDTFGQYDFRCEATINSVSATSDLLVGAVATNANAVVIPPTSRLDFLLAPMLRGGASAWSFYDLNRPRRGAVLAPQIITAMVADINTPLTGTISLTSGGTGVTGVGTTFTGQYEIGAQIMCYYDHGAGVIGRHRMTVQSITNDTAMVLTASWPHGSQTGIQHQRWGTGDGGDADTRWNDSLNYYDNVLALYITYYKTGLTQFATYADSIAQYWWLYLDLGDSLQYAAPRLMAYEGLMVAAERGILDSTSVYDSVQLYSYDPSGSTGPGYENYIYDRNTSTGYQNFYFGARESGYSWRFGVESGYLNPSSTLRSDWVTRLSTNVVNLYLDFQCKATNPANPGRCLTPEGDFRWQDDFRGGPWIGMYGEEPWHTGIIMQGMIRYHRWSNNADAKTVLSNWVSNLLTTNQPGGSTGTVGLYLATTASSFTGIDCRSHYYTNTGGTVSALTSGLTQGDSCPGGADAVYGKRDINNEIVSSYGYDYRINGTAASLARGDDMFGATYGWDDGYGGQWAWRGAANPYKAHGQALCCNDSYLVDRLGSAAANITPVSASATVGFYLAAIPSATKARMTATLPNGSTSTVTCASSPCVITGLDSRQGSTALVQIEYLSAGDVVLASGDQQPVPVT